VLQNTICFLIKRDSWGEPDEILLARKKTGFGVEEELNVRVSAKVLERVAKLTFFFPSRPEWDRVVYVYFADRWQGTPEPSREVDPFWAEVDQLPVEEMWADSGLWLSEILSGRRIVGRFVFGSDNETLKEYEIKEDLDFLWPQLKTLPYFRALLRSVPEAYQGLVQADGALMPFPDGYFASALSNSVLEHIPQLDEVLAETGRVLRPGALFVFCCPNPGYYEKLSIPAGLKKIGLKRLARAYVDWFMRMSRTVHADPPEVWEERLSRAGFALERWWHYFPPGSLRVLEWGHYFGAPSLVAKRIFGRWIIAPTRWNLWLTEKIVRPYAGTELHPNGTYTFFIARKK